MSAAAGGLDFRSGVPGAAPYEQLRERAMLVDPAASRSASPAATI